MNLAHLEHCNLKPQCLLTLAFDFLLELLSYFVAGRLLLHFYLIYYQAARIHSC